MEQLRARAISSLDVPASESGDPVSNRNSKCQSAAFLDSESAYLQVHWCQTEDTTGTESYHMSLIKRYWLDEPDDVWALRRMIDNQDLAQGDTASDFSQGVQHAETEGCRMSWYYILA
jgi:hypothetical protein